MTINQLAILICKKEGLKKQVNIAQVKEILRIINDYSHGWFYKIVKLIK